MEKKQQAKNKNFKEKINLKRAEVNSKFKVRTALPPKKELLDLDEDISTTAKFSISEITMKNDWRWKIKMRVHAILPSTHHDYNIKLVFDDTPFQKTITQLENDIQEIDTHPSMFKDVDKKSIRDLETRIKKTKDDMEKLRAQCTDIEFVTQSEEIKYKDGDTALLFKVLDSVVQPLNEQKYRLVEYRAILTPIYQNNK